MDIAANFGSNRDEVIAIPFHGWLKNPAELMLRYILSKSGKGYEFMMKYPFIRTLVKSSDRGRIFRLTSLYSLRSFLTYMYNSAKGVDPKDIETDYCEITSHMDPRVGSPTQMEAGLMELLSQDFVKKVYIYSPWFSDVTKDYIVSLYQDNLNKIYLVENNLKGIVETMPDVTTIFAESSDELMETLQSHEDHDPSLAGKFFIISAMPSLTMDTRAMLAMGKDPDEIKEKYEFQDYMESLPTRFGSAAQFAKLKMLAPRVERPPIDDNVETNAT